MFVNIDKFIFKSLHFTRLLLIVCAFVVRSVDATIGIPPIQ